VSRVPRRRLLPLLALVWTAAPALAREHWTPLLEAARNADHEAALALVRDGADVTAVEADGTSALHWAAHFGNATLVQALLGAGADAGAANR
jgi:ankyrin repeat protein